MMGSAPLGKTVTMSPDRTGRGPDEGWAEMGETADLGGVDVEPDHRAQGGPAWFAAVARARSGRAIEEGRLRPGRSRHRNREATPMHVRRRGPSRSSDGPVIPYLLGDVS